jgi:hypothetical protein
MGTAKRIAAVVLQIVFGLLLICSVGLVITGGDWNSVLTLSPWPFIGAAVGTLLGSWWDRLHAPSPGTFKCFLRVVSGTVPPVSGKWKYGIATPREGRLAFQPKIGRSGTDDGDIVLLPIEDIGHERDLTWAEMLFKFSPLRRILTFTSKGARIEIAAARPHIQEAMVTLTQPQPY